MHIIAIGLNYRTAPVEIREKVSFNDSELSEAMRVLKEQKSVLENVIVSTCNRTEIYAVVDQLHTGRYYVKAFLAEWFNISKEELSPYLTIYEHDAAIEHLYRVVSGLDSMVLGETQILGQVRSSFLTAQGQGATGTVFNQLFKEAVTLAKRAHHYTDIGANAVSVSYAAVELGKKIFGNLSQKHVLILGAGKMGELAAKNLSGSGVGNVTVINRTKEKAEALAQRFEGNARSFKDLAGALLEADIVISSTSATEYVITKETMKEVEKLRKGRPIFMVDIAVPRDLDPSLSELETVFLYDIDDLEGIVEANLQERQKAAETIEIMIEAAVVEFKTWIGTLGVVPVISALRQKALNIQNETMKSIERKLPNLTERERKVLNKHTKSIINQLLKDPILSAKELAGQKDAEQSLQLFMKIFDIEHMVRDERTIEKKVEKTPLAHEIVHPS
ncbi:glutamyl-tRNA reductase [Priestia endophytica]|uniref:glutamyl-tRNA reductase n=1 Tax=Priestia endophytica TaxID=135735 RepID=UPI000DCA801D|nr:glutamyl-tRNA reductase [Priestia endophytica]RAS88898.1 glutamyl-tRNA reductase [Priestia endophytica]